MMERTASGGTSMSTAMSTTNMGHCPACGQLITVTRTLSRQTGQPHALLPLTSFINQSISNFTPSSGISQRRLLEEGADLRRVPLQPAHRGHHLAFEVGLAGDQHAAHGVGL